MLRRTGDERRGVNLRGSQHAHRRSGELCGGLLIEQLADLCDFFLVQLAILVRGLHLSNFYPFSASTAHFLILAWLQIHRFTYVKPIRFNCIDRQ